MLRKLPLRLISTTLVIAALAAPGPAIANSDLLERIMGITPLTKAEAAEAARKRRAQETGSAGYLGKVICRINYMDLVAFRSRGGLQIPSPRALQAALDFFGHSPGALDGVAGPATRRAATAYARSLTGASCLDIGRAAELVAAHRWWLDRPEADAARVARKHGRMGLVRTYYNRDLPAPHIWTARENDSCGAYANAHLLGEVFGSADRAGTGARQLRVSSVLSPGPMTMDLRPERLNLRLDAFDRVYQISCN